MKYMLTCTPEHVEPGTEDEWAPSGEPVVPWYPATKRDVFLGVESLKPSLHAEVAMVDDDPDDIADRLAKEYPGLPRLLHENYVFGIAAAAVEFPVGTKLRIYVEPDRCMVQVVKDDTRTFTLWEEQPIKKPLEL